MAILFSHEIYRQLTLFFFFFDVLTDFGTLTHATLQAKVVPAAERRAVTPLDFPKMICFLCTNPPKAT